MKQKSVKTRSRNDKTPTKVLWGGVIIAPILCAISLADFVLDYERLKLFDKLWAIFIIAFTAYVTYSFAKDLKTRLQEEKAAK